MEKMENLPQHELFKIVKLSCLHTEDFGDIGKALLYNVETKKFIHTYCSNRIVEEHDAQFKATGFKPDFFMYYGKKKSKKNAKEHHAFNLVSSQEWHALKILCK